MNSILIDENNLPEPNNCKKGGRFKDLTDQKFGRLTALYPVDKKTIDGDGCVDAIVENMS